MTEQQHDILNRYEEALRQQQEQVAINREQRRQRK